MKQENVTFVSPLTTFVAHKQQRVQSGFKLLEFAVATAIFALLAAMLLQRMWYYQGQAEEVGAQHVVASLRTALEIKVVQSRMPGHALDYQMLAEQNPMQWLARPPANYAGELFSPTTEELTPGHWYFDRHDKILIYLLNYRTSFGTSELKRLKFKVKLFRLPKSSVKPEGASEINGVALEQVNG